MEDVTEVVAAREALQLVERIVGRTVVHEHRLVADAHRGERGLDRRHELVDAVALVVHGDHDRKFRRAALRNRLARVSHSQVIAPAREPGGET